MSRLIREQLAADPRVQQARALLAEAAAEHQARLTGVRPADPDRRLAYQRLLDEFAALRGAPLYYPYLGSGIGRGALVELADGSVKYDLINGIGVHHLGHGHPLVLQAGIDAALADTLMQGHLQQTTASLSLTRRLLELAQARGAALSHGLLTTSGAMANENALKLALQKRSPASRLLAFARGFAGRTLVLAQVTDKPALRVGLPTVVAVDHVPFFDPQRPQASTDEAVAALRHHLARYPDQHAAMVLELIQGEGGFYPASRPFLLAICQVLREHDVAIIFDEIQTFGRTSAPFAFQHFELDDYADIVTLGKMTQVCATLFSDAYAPRPGLISQTFTGATAAILAAEHLLDELQARNCFGPDGRNMQIHERFVRRLAAMAERHRGQLRGPYGLGAMIAFTPLDGSAERVRCFAQALFEAGVIAFTAGENPTRLRFLPPVPVIRDEDIDAVCDVVETTLAQVAGESTSR